jgi:hypothetical protein
MMDQWVGDTYRATCKEFGGSNPKKSDVSNPARPHIPAFFFFKLYLAHSNQSTLWRTGTYQSSQADYNIFKRAKSWRWFKVGFYSLKETWVKLHVGLVREWLI